jgi:hypothetical protein
VPPYRRLAIAQSDRKIKGKEGIQMKAHTLTVVLVVSIAAAAVFAAAASAAGPPSPASGTDTVTSLNVTSTQQDGGNTIYEGTFTGVLTGTITGTYVGQFRWIIHPSGEFEFHSTGVDTVTTPCGSGETPFLAETHGTDDSITGIHEGIDAAGNTANVATNLHFVGDLSQLTYTGNYHCLS